MVSTRWPVVVTSLILALLVSKAPDISASDLSRTHALLINGGGSSRINYRSHLLHLKRIYRILDEAGVPTENISVLSSDGANPDPDLATREVQGEANFWLLSGTRLEKVLRPRIQYENSDIEGAVLQPATREVLEQWFEKAKSELRPDDALLLYVTDHGTLNKEDPSNNQITLWGKDEYIDVQALKSLLQLLHPSVKVVTLMSQCFSGSFANLMFGKPGDEEPPRNLGGYFSSTADRPAYGCYPENREEYQVGHSFRFFDALEAGDAFAVAHANVLISDRTPDVPVKSSDLFLESILTHQAELLSLEFDEHVDRLLQSAWKDRKAWETEIRLLDRMGESFGYFSPRFLSELARHSELLSAVGKQLDDYEIAWRRTLLSLNRANLARFSERQPDWDQRLSADELKRLNGTDRAELAHELLIDLADFTEQDPETAQRLKLLREKAKATREASYRVKVREAIVLRMRFVLISIAGRQYLSKKGSDWDKVTYDALAEAEAFALMDAERPQNHRADVIPFPRFDEEIELANSSLPGWMGIRFRPVTPERREKYDLEDGSVSVLAVFPDSPARKSGLEAGDIIVGLPGRPFTERDFVREWVMTAPIGEAQSLQIQRGEERLTLALIPEPYPREWPSLPGPPKVGSPAPALGQIEAFRGSSPEELSGQGPHLLFFWATWCGPCKAAVPELLAFEREQNIPVISITDETAESVEAFLQERDAPFPEAIVLDEYRRAFLAYGVSATPSFVLVDAHGKVQSTKSGYRLSEGLMIENWAWAERQTTVGSTSH